MAKKNKPLKVGLLTTLDHNIGDDFIREGLVQAVQRVFAGRDLTFMPINKHEPHTAYPAWHPIRLSYGPGFKPRRKSGPVRRVVERVLPPLGGTAFESCDFILQCGTPILWDGCRNSEWARLIWRDIFARLARKGTPILNLGGGSCYAWENAPATLVGNADESFVHLMLEASRATMVRDTLARELLASLGGKVGQACCPALLSGQLHRQPVAPTRKVMVNYMRGGGHFDWGQGIDGTAWEKTMRDAVDHLVGEGWQVVLLAHNQEELKLASSLWPNFPATLPRTTAEYFHAMYDAAFGVFNRMHASVAAAGLGIPSVAIGTDTRNLMVKNVGLSALYVKTASTPTLLDVIANLTRTRDEESRRLLALREKTLQDYEDCLRANLDV